MTGVLRAIVGAISDDLVYGLSALGRPPLTDGAILFGAPFVSQLGAPPRVVFERTTSRFGPAQHATLGGAYLANTALAGMLLGRILATEFVRFKVRVWGIADPTPGSAQDPAADYDAVNVLRRDVVRSCVRIFPSISIFDQGVTANSERPGDTLLPITGQYEELVVEIATPVTDYPLEWANALTPTKPIGHTVNTSIQPGDGAAPEAGPQINYTPPDP